MTLDVNELRDRWAEAVVKPEELAHELAEVFEAALHAEVYQVLPGCLGDVEAIARAILPKLDDIIPTEQHADVGAALGLWESFEFWQSAPCCDKDAPHGGICERAR